MHFGLSVDTRGLLRKCLFSASDIDFKSTIQILGLDTRRRGIEIVCNPIVIETSLILFSRLLESPVFDPISGFGGTGVPGTYILPEDPDGTSKFFDRASFVGCVQDGPFASQTIRLGPGKLITDHCLVRGVNDAFKTFLTSRSVAAAMNLPSFFEFHVDLEGAPLTPTNRIHDGGHVAVGGEMSNFYSSPAGQRFFFCLPLQETNIPKLDPLFYLHHANLDRIWWNWQQMLPSRLYEISGRSTPNPPYQNVTLDSDLEMGNLAPTVTIRNVMDIHGESNCYTYV